MNPTPSASIIAELRSADRWLRLYSTSENQFEIKVGNGNETCAILSAPLGVRWYRTGSNLPDGERQATWQRAEIPANGDEPWLLHGEIMDSVSGSWRATTQVRKDGEGFRLQTTFTRHGPAREASVRVHTEFAAVPGRAYTLIPGAVYNGNRADVIVPRTYCPLLTEHELQTREKGAVRRVITDLPRQDASTWWTAHLWGNQAASASVSAYDPETQAGVHLGHARSEGGRVLGVIHTADADTEFHQVTIENPSVRNLRYRFSIWDMAPDRPHSFSPGESAVIDLRLFPVQAASIPGFIDTWHGERELRRQGLAPGQDGVPPRTPDVMPRSHATRETVGWIDRNRWNDLGFYRNGELENPRELVLGWGHGTSMMMGMYRLGDEGVRSRIRRMIEFILEEAQAPGGLFYGVRLQGLWLGSDGNLDSFHAMGALTPRRTTDTIPHAMELVDALRAEEGGTHRDLADRLDAALQRACEALVRVVRRDGTLPFLLDPLTERAVWPGGFAGARLLTCLARGARRWNRPDWIEVARELASLLARTGLDQGDVWGGPSDIMQGTSDNESLTALAEGLTELHAVTGDPEHLRRATQAADLLATWALDEEIAFPAESLLGRNGINPFGAMIASTQNACGTPGLCVNSGRFLLDLYERTGSGRYLDLLSDISRVPMQMIIRPGQVWGDLKTGQMTECISFSDVPAEFGEVYCMSAVWPVNAMLLSEIELPSIYVDGERIWRFDHLTATAGPDGLAVGNPTAYPARARIQWRGGEGLVVELAPGESRVCAPPASSPLTGRVA